MEVAKLNNLGLAKNCDTMNVAVINHGLTTKTFRFFNDNGLPNVDDNETILTLKDIPTTGEVRFTIIADSIGKTYQTLGTGSPSVAVINNNTEQLEAVINIGAALGGMAFDTLNSKLYLCAQRYVYVINTSSNTVESTIDFGAVDNPFLAWAYYSNITDRLYVFDLNRGRVYAIDPNTNTIGNYSTAPTSVLNQNILQNYSISYSSDLNRIIFMMGDATSGAFYILKVNPQTLAFDSPILLTSTGNPIDSPLVYVQSSVTMCANSVSASFPDPNLYITNLVTGIVSTYSVGYGLSVNSFIGQVAVDTTNNILYASQLASDLDNIVCRFDLNTNTEISAITIPSAVLDQTFTCIYDPEDQYLYVGTVSQKKLYVLDAANNNALIYTFTLTDNTAGIYSIGNNNLVIAEVNGIAFIKATPQVEIIVNGGVITVEDLLQFVKFSPICVSDTLYETNIRNNINQPLLYQVTTSTGEIQSTQVSVAKNFTANNSDTLTVVDMPQSQFPNCVYDGVHYLQSAILGSNTLNFSFKYCQTEVSLTGQKDRPKRIKKYIRHEFRILKEN